MPDTPAPSSPATARPGGSRVRKALLLLGGGVVLVLGAWVAFSMLFVYSSGTRVGFAQKLSQKGWLCKTWEGELAMATVPGVMPEKFQFTVRSDSVAAAIGELEGKRVSLRYEQHRFLPTSCLGETEYWVTGVEVAPE